LGELVGEKKYPKTEIPTLSNIIKAKITINKKTNLETRVFEFKKSVYETEFPLVVENELYPEPELSLI
jgi:hypothetical protein